GRYYQLERAPFAPGPLQEPHIPLALGANGPKMLRIAARYTDTWVTTGTADDARLRGAELSRYCGEIGRDPDSLRRALYIWGARATVEPFSSVDAYREIVERYREAGISEFVFAMPRRELRPVMRQIAEELLPKWRSE